MASCSGRRDVCGYCKFCAGGLRAIVGGDDAPKEMGSCSISTHVPQPVRSNPGGSDAAWGEMKCGADVAYADHSRLMDVHADLEGRSGVAQSCGRQGGES